MDAQDGGGRGPGGAPEDGGSGDGPDGGASAGAARTFDARMLEALICPLTYASLEWDAERCELISRRAGLAYPVRDGIPIMLETEARRLS